MSKIKVKEVMTKQVLTTTVDATIEEAARTLIDNKIGGLPVVRDGNVVGIITETDLFQNHPRDDGRTTKGVRASVLVSNKAGEIARLSEAIFQAGGNIIALGTFLGTDPSTSELMFKVSGPDEATLRAVLEPLALKVKDIRTY